MVAATVAGLALTGAGTYYGVKHGNPMTQGHFGQRGWDATKRAGESAKAFTVTGYESAKAQLSAGAEFAQAKAKAGAEWARSACARISGRTEDSKLASQAVEKRCKSRS